MTYGVDQCRICGAAILVKNPEVWKEQDRFNRKPIIPEKEWRARGFLTSPTRTQLFGNPADGCCSPCGLKLMKKTYRYHTRALVIIVFALAMWGIIVGVITYLPH